MVPRALLPGNERYTIRRRGETKLSQIVNAYFEVNIIGTQESFHKLALLRLRKLGLSTEQHQRMGHGVDWR